MDRRTDRRTDLQMASVKVHIMGKNILKQSVQQFNIRLHFSHFHFFLL